MKCISCSITIPEMPEDATVEELLCDGCYAKHDPDHDSVCEVCGAPCEYDPDLCLCKSCEKKGKE